MPDLKTGPDGYGSRWHYLLALLIGAAISAALVRLLLPLVYLFQDPDTAFYVEAARNFLAGKGLTVSSSLAHLPSPTEPLSLWPPGFPLMIAFGARLTGLEPARMALWIGWASWSLLPPALCYCLRPFLGNWTIHAIAALAMLAPGAVEFGWQPMSDLPFLLLVVLSFAALFRGLDGRAGLMLLSGLLAGAAYSVRNAGIAVFPAVILVLMGAGLANLLPLRKAFRNLFWWFLGAGLALAPLLAHNLWVFGQLQPYAMPPSTLGLNANSRYFTVALLADLIARPQWTDPFLWRTAILGGFFLVPIAVIAASRKFLIRQWAMSPPAKKIAVLLLIAYFLFGAAVLVAARSRYEWGEFIAERHILQFDWLLLAVPALILGAQIRRGRVMFLALGVCIALLALRLTFLGWEAAEHRIESMAATAPEPVLQPAPNAPRSGYYGTRIMRLSMSRDSELIGAIRKLPADAVLFSNYDDVLVLRAGRIVHRLILGEHCELPKSVMTADMRVPYPKAILLLFPTLETRRSGCWAKFVASPNRDPILPARRSFVSFSNKSS